MVPFKHRLRGCDGFTFNELLVSMNLIAVVVLGYSLSSIGVTRQQTVSSNSTVALHLAQDKIEELQARPLLTDVDLCPSGGDHGLSAKLGVPGNFDRCWKIFPSLARRQSETDRRDRLLARPRRASCDLNRRDLCRWLMKRPFRQNQRGVTLIEQLVSLLLGAAMITSLYGYFRHELYRFLSLEIKTSTLEDSRGALDIMVRDLKNAGSWGTGSAPAETGAADDPSGDADTVCNRVYSATPSAASRPDGS